MSGHCDRCHKALTPLFFIRGEQLATGHQVGILDNSCMGDMTEAGGWHVLMQVIHSRHPTWLATDQVPSLAGFLVSSGGDSFVAYH